MGKPTSAELLLRFGLIKPEASQQRERALAQAALIDDPGAQQRVLESHRDLDTDFGPGLEGTHLDAALYAPSVDLSYRPPKPPGSHPSASLLPSAPGSLSVPNLTHSSSSPASKDFRPTQIATEYSDNDSSDTSSESDCSPVSDQRQMCTPKQAKMLSIETDCFYVITRPGPIDREDESEVSGNVIQGYINGCPVYYQNEGMHVLLKSIETTTAIGMRYVSQPIETCFSSRLSETDDTDSGYASISEVGASPAPMNRAFSNKWFEVRKSPISGHGVFAAVDIPQFTHILLEQPFVRLKSYNQLRDKYERLNAEEKHVFDALHPFDPNSQDPVQKRWSANSFVVGHGEGCFAIASNFNHACHAKRNTQYRWDSTRRVMTFTTIKSIPRGQEILISYGTRRDLLYERFGFLCKCGGCEDLGWEIPYMFLM